MKHIAFSLGLLTLILVFCLGSAAHLGTIVSAVNHQLTQAETAAESGDWHTASALTQEAQTHWDSHTLFLYALLRHEEVDIVLSGFRQVTEFINCQEEGEYSAANAQLMAQIALLHEMEQLSLENLL